MQYFFFSWLVNKNLTENKILNLIVFIMFNKLLTVKPNVNFLKHSTARKQFLERSRWSWKQFIIFSFSGIRFILSLHNWFFQFFCYFVSSTNRPQRKEISLLYKISTVIKIDLQRMLKLLCFDKFLI